MHNLQTLLLDDLSQNGWGGLGFPIVINYKHTHKLCIHKCLLINEFMRPKVTLVPCSRSRAVSRGKKTVIAVTLPCEKSK